MHAPSEANGVPGRGRTVHRNPDGPTVSTGGFGKMSGRRERGAMVRVTRAIALYSLGVGTSWDPKPHFSRENDIC